jgi:hypothetical protein
VTRNDTTSPPTRTAPGTDEATRRRPPQDPLLASLGRRFSGASLQLEFELRTACTRQIFHRDFAYVSRQLHALEASRRVPGIDRALLAACLAAIGRSADAERTLLLQYGADTRALIAAHGHAGADIGFGDPRPLRATIVSPHARDYLELLGQADDALAQLEKAWLLGLLGPVAKARQASDCRRALHDYKETVRRHRECLADHVREVNAARQRGAQAVPASGRRATGSPAAPTGARGSSPGPATQGFADLGPATPPALTPRAVRSPAASGSMPAPDATPPAEPIPRPTLRAGNHAVPETVALPAAMPRIARDAQPANAAHLSTDTLVAAAQGHAQAFAIAAAGFDGRATACVAKGPVIEALAARPSRPGVAARAPDSRVELPPFADPNDMRGEPLGTQPGPSRPQDAPPAEPLPGSSERLRPG